MPTPTQVGSGTEGRLAGTAGDMPRLNYQSKVVAPRNPRLVRGELPPPKMTPSKFLHEMGLDTAGKLANTHEMHLPQIVELLDMAETTHQKFSQVNIDEAMFQPFPSEIRFQNYESHQTYEVPLQLRNNDGVPRLVKVYQTDSPYFKIISPNNVGDKVAPGMASTFRILFTPLEKKDYVHELLCITEREKFVVPVHCIGARAILDFPDYVNFSAWPVKHTATQTLLVRNIGNKDATFSLAAQRPFSVSPSCGVLPVGESMQVTVEFTAPTTGDHVADLVLTYDTGEQVFVELHGVAVNANVRLDKSSLRIENTYISMANQRTINIVNRSDVIVHYHWKLFATVEEESQQRTHYTSELSHEESVERERFLEECITDPTLRDKMSLLTRTYENRRRIVSGDSMLFADDVFQIEPLEGEIWPNQSAEVSVIFKPQEAKTYQQVAYLDITGREARLPLRLRGDGVGPNVQFSFEQLDMGNIFVGSIHTYEVVLANKGDIDAIFSILPNNTHFGLCFTFNPTEGIVLPDGHQAIQITFRSATLGDFQEDFYIAIDGSPQRLKLSFRGCVIGPTFHFDVPRLNFGVVSYGFQHTQTCTIVNTALVPMTFSLHVPGDGTGERSICSLLDLEDGTHASDHQPNQSVSSALQEFIIVPSSGTIPAQSQVKVQVTLVSNTVKKYDSMLVVDVQGVGQGILMLPIVAKCIVPTLAVVTPVLDFGRCFLGFPYEHSIKILNDTELPAKYDIIPQAVDDASTLTYQSSQWRGILQPHTVTEIPLTCTAQQLNEAEEVVYIHIFGSQDPPMQVHVCCVGEGPVVHVAPTELDWGDIRVLTDVHRTVQLSNESLIPAPFSAQMMRPGSVWRVEPQKGVIPPESAQELVLTAHLDDCIRFKDKLYIQYPSSQPRTIVVQAYGHGTTIVANPPITPAVHLGPHFSDSPCQYHFQLTNKGRRHQQLFWHTEGFPMYRIRRATSNNNNNQNGPTSEPIFHLKPHRMELNPGQTIDVMLEGLTKKPQVLRERMLCHAIIGQSSGKEHIMTMDINVEFIAPLLDLSTRNINFRIDKNPEDVLEVQHQPLELRNMSSLPLTVLLDVDHPFALLFSDGRCITHSELVLAINETIMLQVQFDPAYCSDAHSRTEISNLNISYKEHPSKDKVQLCAEVHFPNLTFEKMDIDFGCILNDTEVTRYLDVTNESPMPVKYRWSFLLDDPTQAIKFSRQTEEGEVVEQQVLPEHTKLQLHPEEEEEFGETVAMETGRGEKEPEKDDFDLEGDDKYDEMVREVLSREEIGAEDAEEEMVVEDLPPETGRQSVVSRTAERPTLEERREVLPPLPWLQKEDPTLQLSTGIEEVFDILPLYGILHPGETQRVSFTFYGHSGIGCNATAICEVEGGPTYEVTLKGEASLLEYRLEGLDIDYGKQLFDQVAEAEIVLYNTGKVDFEFAALNMDPMLQNSPPPGMPVLVPHTGQVAANSQQTLTLKFLPGAPEKFHKKFQIQVAHFEPDIITVHGEGIFPRLSFDLPRLPDEDGHYTSLMVQAREALTVEHKVQKQEPVSRAQSELSLQPAGGTEEVFVPAEPELPSELDLQMEVERRILHQHATSVHPKLKLAQPPNVQKKLRKQLTHTELPHYLLHFGYVVLGEVRIHIVRVTNTGYVPVSFSADQSRLHHSGFHIGLHHIHSLPGYPHHETMDFQVTFDPRGANLDLGEVEATVPLHIQGGPTIMLCLRATVTMPEMQVSEEVLDFGTVQCGQCQVITVQLYNHKQVRCEWSSVPQEKQKKGKVARHVPMHLRRQMWPDNKPKPRHFEIMPSSGVLLPGQRVNVQVKFMPTEETLYHQRLPIQLAQSSRRLVLLVSGQGQEPRLEFSSSLLEFGPILPHSSGDEQEIMLRNPAAFPIEVYSLEFDQQYLDEEKILRLMKGYDEQHTLLLPPRSPGDGLPFELQDFYQEYKKRPEGEREDGAGGLEVQDHTTPQPSIPPAPSTRADPDSAPHMEPSPEDEPLDADGENQEAAIVGVGELEITPVSASIARHLGIDLSPEGKAARNRRGIAIVVHGAPLSGKTGTAVTLAKTYGAAMLTIDGIVLEAISSGNTPSGLRAREMCAAAARENAARDESTDADKSTAVPGSLSVDALTAHTAAAGAAAGSGSVSLAGGAAPSIISNVKKTSIVSGAQKAGGSKAGGNISTGEASSQPAGGTSSPPPAAPIQRRLSVSASVAGEEGLMSCVLPEELLVEILAERFQLNDCHQGVVMDGLETLFSPSQTAAGLAVLKAFNNRKYMYFITLGLEMAVLKARKQKEEEEKERLAKQKEEEEKAALEEMSEDEYDNLSPEQRAEIDRRHLVAKKERMQREMEDRLERERRERELQAQLEAKREEEERLKHKGKRGKGKDDGGAAGKKSVAGGKPGGAPSQDRVAALKAVSSHGAGEHGAKGSPSAAGRPESHETDKSDEKDEGGKKKKGKDGKGRPVSTDVTAKESSATVGEEPVPEPPPEEVQLSNRFKAYEHTQKEISPILEFWDRTQLIVHRPTTPEEEKESADDQPPPSAKRGRAKDKEKERLEKEKQEKERLEKEKLERLKEGAGTPTSQLGGEPFPADSDKGGEEQAKEELGVPHIILDASDPDDPCGPRLLTSGQLPPVDEILDGLGLGPGGPPIPPPATFSVVPYPVKRKSPPGTDVASHYIFVAASQDDPNVAPEDRLPDVEPDTESVTPDKSTKPEKEEHTATSSRGRSKERDKRSGTDSVKDRRKSASRKGRRSSLSAPSPPPGAATPGSEADGQSTIGDTSTAIEHKSPKLSTFRWVIPAGGDVTLRLRFTSEDLGQFDQTLNFEIVGTRRRYQLYCRGICAFPTISREPRVVFPHRKKSKKSDEIIHKKYVLGTEIMEFGPLLCGKTRDRYKEGRYPENMEKLTIMNTSPLEADITFCFQQDAQATTYLLDPPSMLLKPTESQELTIWAYPKTPGYFEDCLVCCVRENPEPVVFRISCHGVKPEIEMDRKQLFFEKVLLHRKDTKTIYLRNPTLLPVAWRISGVENLGDDFSLSAEQGVIDPKSELALHAHFRAMKPTNTKKIIRLEVSDVDNIMGLVDVENIQVHAEAYDVALDMSFPKGADGGLDFGVIRVMDETKQTLTLKNKGRYEIGYEFMFETSDPNLPEVGSLFSVLPQHGSLLPTDRPTQVQVIFRSRYEVNIKDQPILRCKVIEPSLGDQGETIASIPIKLSVRSVFSRYIIYPEKDIHFGAMMVNSRKSRTITIENKGEFDFKYSIIRYIKETAAQSPQKRLPVPGKARTKSRDGSSSGKSITKPKKAESVRQEVTQANQSRLMLGMFTVYPGFGLIQPGGHQQVQVDCLGEQPGREEVDIAIEISDRDPEDHPGGIPYRLVAEACIPSINTSDIGAIFEEHRIVQNSQASEMLSQLQLESGGMYVEEDNKFVFNNVMVGRKARARFQITNTNKVPCDVAFSVKPLSIKPSSKLHGDVFDVEPSRVAIPTHSHMYVVVSFSPSTMQSFTGLFEATVEGLPSTLAKARNLSFELVGEGTLPRVTLVQPALFNKQGMPLLLYRRLLLGHTQALPMVLKNDGTLPCKVDIDLLDPERGFSLRLKRGSKAIQANGVDSDEEDEPQSKQAHTMSVIVENGVQVEFDVLFKPGAVQQYKGTIHLSVMDNQYEETNIQLIGEGYEEEVTIENLPALDAPLAGVTTEALQAQEEIQAVHGNHLDFGDCAIGEPHQLSFTITNHSKQDVYRFTWPEHAALTFSPQTGHLHPKCTKDITIVFKSDEPKPLSRAAVACKICKILLKQTPDQVQDWDDRLRVIKWVDGETIQVPQEGDKKTTKDQPTPGSGTARLSRKKVTETAEEPGHTVVENSTRDLELQVSATCDFAKLKWKTESIGFKDTLMFQSRIYEFTLNNKGTVSAHFNWQLVTDGLHKSVSFAAADRPPTAPTPDLRPSSRMMLSPPPGEDLTTPSPFSISPETGTVPAGKKQTFSVKFSPMDIRQYEAKLVCSIPNLEEGKQAPVLAVRGRGLLPYCHFELEDSDYINARRNPQMRGPRGAPPGATLDPNTRVIEFAATGISVKTSRSFFILNPTNKDYSFLWNNEDQSDSKLPSPFTCQTSRGHIQAGRKTKVGFQFCTQQLGVVESFWCFTIPELSISVPFLLTGSASEPKVVMDRSHLNFKPLLLGHSAVETIGLCNKEPRSFAFEFLESSLHSEGHAAALTITPMAGTVPPNASFPIDVAFSPTEEKQVNFNVVCHVQQKTEPLVLNVKAEGYTTNASVQCEDSAGKKVTLTPQGLNQVSFGQVQIYEKAVRTIHIVNNGKFTFDFNWLKEQQRNPETVIISPEIGSVPVGAHKKCMLTFCPTTRMTLQDCQLALQITNGPTYDLKALGSGVTPGLHFSFLNYDFGPCFVHHAGMPVRKVALKVTNKDSKEVSVNCLFTNTTHLEVQFEPTILSPKESCEVHISFLPRHCVKYFDVLPFEINGLSQTNVEIRGEGTEMTVEVADKRQKIVQLGALLVGTTVKKVVSLVNKSLAPITFNLVCTPSSHLLQDSRVLSISPYQSITLKPRGGKVNAEVTFSPRTRIPQFTEEVMMESEGFSQPLFVLMGSCQGIEVQLDQESIPFGAVVMGSSSTRRMVMRNVGDIGTKFQWKVRQFAPDFSINPSEGYISPGMEVAFNVVFHPTKVSQDIRYEDLECVTEGRKKILLTLTGMCVSTPALKEVLNFSTHVRQKDTKTVTISNRTNQTWELHPVIDGEFWAGLETFLVDPQQNKAYELVYKPLCMTAEGKKHTGTVFFPLPDGTGLLYNLTGTAEPPKAISNITREVPCKTGYTELLTVSNWLKHPQRFRVSIDMVKPDRLDQSTSLKGLDYIDVPGLGKRDYKLNFFAHREGTVTSKVVFREDTTGEYQFYFVTFKATPPGTISTLYLTTPVRQSASHTVTVENPLAVPITFSTDCKVADVSLPPQFVVPAQSEGSMMFEYLPLKAGETNGRLALYSSELGHYTYDLVLRALPAGPERALHFKASLGANQTQTAHLTNFSKQKVEYLCKVDNSDFHVEKTVNAAPGSQGGTEVGIDVTYEPSKLGQSRATLTVSSAVGGEYTFPLVGNCLAPKPQGPYTIRAGSTASIPFKNIFPHTTAFTFTVDNTAFSVKAGETIRAKKTHSIIVGFEGNTSGSKAPKMGKLVVSCPRSAGGEHNVTWTFYVKGVTPS
ncbi:LOW QUALITY PROTEIN: hydrocephalus-inducing protein homolog [Branchiostoma floridae]|uniref:LOW QUALITY PROTEIN: hydrocephalus-inducing protein homolog n=1 Tax=Branchiostoma floridae TaxID=7739 RepID=A0A9J7LA92_BRAFL|nr:LOW QUALITY PROTEIN: hydrocephalus-inducing protein homolog [Branchiostoma floridae]